MSRPLALVLLLLGPAAAQAQLRPWAGSPAPETDARLLQLAAGSWDPLVEADAAPGPRLPDATSAAPLPSALAGDELSYWILQAERRGVLLPEAIAESEGLEIVGRIPNQAWLVRVAGDPSERLAELPDLRWKGEWQASFKIGPRLAALLEGEPPAPAMLTGGLLRLHAAFHRGVEAADWASTLESLPSVTVRATRDGEALLHLEFAGLAGGVARLARLRDLSALSIDELPGFANDEQPVAGQSGLDCCWSDLDLGASLFARGITGQGLAIALADEGLQNDLADFRYTDARDDASWQPVGDDPFETEGLTLSAPRTRLRKVRSTIVYDGASLQPGPWRHGTHVASVALGDRGGGLGVLSARPVVRDLGRRQAIATCENGGVGWAVGDVLRPDLAAATDDPFSDDPGFDSVFGERIEHHDELDGGAPGAQLVLQDIGADGELSGVLFGFQSAEDAWTHGATVGLGGFGGEACDACYTGAAPGSDLGTWTHRMVVKVHAAGNEGAAGTSTILAGYAQAKNTIVVGATEAASSPSAAPATRLGEDLAPYSSRGPKSGGFLAPDLVVPGELRVRSSDDDAIEDGSGVPVDPGTEEIVSGTSFAAANLTGMAVLVQQYFLDGYYPLGEAAPEYALRPTNALVRAVLTNSARDLRGARTDDDGSDWGHRPSLGQGWGRPVLDDTLYFAGDPVRGIDPSGDLQRAGLVVLTDTPAGLQSGDFLTPEPGGSTRDQIVESLRPSVRDAFVEEFEIEVSNPDPADPAYELRITMAYTDIDGLSVTGRTTVNDLDLEVISPTGVVYRPDPFTAWAGGYTLPSVEQEEQVFEPFTGFRDIPDRDSIHTVENVFIRSEDAEEGTWRIRVIGFDVPGNGRARNDLTPNLILNDNPPSVDTDLPCDGIPDVDQTDRAFSTEQGFALVVSGGVRPSLLPCGDFRLGGAVRVQAASDCQALVSWDRASGAFPPVEYDLYRSDSLPVLQDAAHLVAGGLRGTSYLDSPPSPGTWYYRVVGEDSCDDPGPRRAANEDGDSEGFEILPLDFPGPVIAVPEGDCALRVSWLEATGHGEIVHDVYRSESLPVDLGAANRVASALSGTDWLDEGWLGAPVHYRVVARDLCDEAPNAGGDSVAAQPSDGAPPEFEGIVDTRDLGYCEVEVSWDESTASDACSGVASYNVYRDNGVGRRGRTLVASGVPGSPFIDTTPGNGTWVYVVRAVDAAGNEEQNEVFQQESENSCTNDFPEDAGMDDENGVDPPNGDGGHGIAPPPAGGDLASRLEARIERSLGRFQGHGDMRIAWLPSPSEGGLYPISYSVLRGDLMSLAETGYSHQLVTPETCGITAHQAELVGQDDGGSWYYLVVPVSGDNATFGYDHLGVERPAAPVCE